MKNSYTSEYIMYSFKVKITNWVMGIELYTYTREFHSIDKEEIARMHKTSRLKDAPTFYGIWKQTTPEGGTSQETGEIETEVHHSVSLKDDKWFRFDEPEKVIEAAEELEDSLF